MVQNLQSWIDMENQIQDIIALLKKNKIKGVEGKEKELKRENLDGKYSIWVELKVSEYLLENGYSIEIIPKVKKIKNKKTPDIKINEANINKNIKNIYIEIKRFEKEDFKEQEVVLNLIEYLNKNFPEWKKINFQLFIEYCVGSSSVVNEKRNIKTILLDDDWLKNQLYQDIVNALKQKKEKDNKTEFYPYKFGIHYFNNYNIKANKKFFIGNCYSGDNENDDSEKWLSNKINILAVGAKDKFSYTNFNILFVYYPFIKRDYIDNYDWKETETCLNVRNDIKKIYNAVILSDFSKYFKTAKNKNDQKIIDTLFHD